LHYKHKTIGRDVETVQILNQLSMKFDVLAQKNDTCNFKANKHHVHRADYVSCVMCKWLVSNLTV